MARYHHDVMKPYVELVCSSVEDCVIAERAGADRIELAVEMSVGGLTPSIGTMRAARAAVKIPIMAMVRPRSGGFAFTCGEFDAMVIDAQELIAAGADGLVFGVSNMDGTLDVDRMAVLQGLCGDKDSICHRAFDVTPNAVEAMESLIEIGITRILTSGQKPVVPEGAPLIKSLIQLAAGRIEIMPGCGITPENALEMIEATGTHVVHLSLFGPRADTSAQHDRGITFNRQSPVGEQGFEVVDEARLVGMVSALHGG